jgi:hypothetical protein
MSTNSTMVLLMEQVIVEQFFTLRYINGAREPESASDYTELFDFVASVYMFLLLEHLASLPQVSRLNISLWK